MVAGFGLGAGDKESGQDGGSNTADADKLGHHSLHCVGRKPGVMPENLVEILVSRSAGNHYRSLDLCDGDHAAAKPRRPS